MKYFYALTWITAPDFYFTIDLHRKNTVKWFMVQKFENRICDGGINCSPTSLFATLYIMIVTVSLLMHELLPMNLNFQVKNEQNNTFCCI